MTELERLLDMAYKAMPELREILETYKRADEAYRAALEALRPKYVIITTDTNGDSPPTPV